MKPFFSLPIVDLNRSIRLTLSFLNSPIHPKTSWTTTSTLYLPNNYCNNSTWTSADLNWTLHFWAKRNSSRSIRTDLVDSCLPSDSRWQVSFLSCCWDMVAECNSITQQTISRTFLRHIACSCRKEDLEEHYQR